MGRINLKALTEGRESNQITLSFDINICHCRISGVYGGKVIFPTRKNQSPKEWSSFSLPDWKLTGKPRRNKKEMALLIEWIKKYEYEIIEIGCGQLNWFLFCQFLYILQDEKILENFILFKKEKTLLPLDIMLVNWKEFDNRKFAPVVVCLDSNLDFIGVVDIIHPQEAVFIEEFRELKYIDIIKWIKEYKKYIIGFAYGKIDFNEFLSKLELDNGSYVHNDSELFLFIKGYEKYSKEIVLPIQRNRQDRQDLIKVSFETMSGYQFLGKVYNDSLYESINETKPPDQIYVNGKHVYTFDINYKDDDHPDNILNLCDETYNTEVSRDIHFLSYKFKEHSEVSGNFLDEKEFNDVKSEFRKQLKKTRNKINWSGEKFIKQALEKLKNYYDADYKKYNDICVIIYPTTPSHDKLTDSIVYEIQSSVFGANEIEDKKIMELRLINNEVQKEDSWYRPSEERELNIWFDAEDLYQDLLYSVRS